MTTPSHRRARQASKASLGSDVWTVILAAGDGKRLLPLTRALHGCEMPKQFAEIQKGRSLLQATVARAALFGSFERTLVVVARERVELARAQLARFPGVRVVAQPRNVGTGPGILLPLSHVLAENPAARVVILPSDHFVRDEDSFADSILRADASSRATGSIVLLGAEPDRAEAEYGWIVPTSDVGDGARGVACFREKPSSDESRALFRGGALWNTFIMLGPAERFWELGRRHLPATSLLFDAYRRAIRSEGRMEFLEDIYERMAPADFSHEVLEKAGGLRVLPLTRCGWSDWGTPARVLHGLRGTADLGYLKERLRKVRGASRDDESSVMALVALAS